METARLPIDHPHQNGRHGQGGNETAQKDAHDGGICHGSNHDHEDGRRNQDSHPGRSRHNGDRMLGLVAGFQHRRSQHGADRRDIRNTGAGDAGEEIFGRHRGHAEPPFHPAHQRPGEVNQLVGHSAPLHQGPGKNKAGYGQEHEAVGAADDAGRQFSQFKVADEQSNDPGQAHGKNHRRPDCNQQHKSGGRQKKKHPKTP